MARKTVNLADVVNTVNARIAMNPSPEARTALAMLVGDLLLEADVYAGFGYLDTPYVAGETDTTRVRFNISSKLRA